MIGGATAQHW